MLVDTHLHLSETEGISPSLYIENAKKVDVNKLISSFCEKDDIRLSTLFVEKYDCLYATIGYHPQVASRIVEDDFEILKKTIINNKKIVGIGEIGLDYYWDKDNKEKQRDIFERQLLLAEELNLPVVIHTRDSIGETYDILKNHSVKGIIHCFSGSLEMAQKFIELGFLLGIGGVVTFKNSNLPHVISNIGLESIVLETDSPYLSPEPNRGKINESANIVHIARKIADIKGIEFSEVARITTENAIGMFDLDQ